MMKMMILAGRRAGMSHAEFRQYVTQVHGPLVKSVPEVAAAIRHYHYNFPLAAATDRAFNHPLATDLDIVTQGWFDSREAQLANMANPRYLAIIRPDEGRFANEAQALMHYTAETAVSTGDSAAVKIFYFRRRRPGLSRAAFQEAWRTQYARALTASNAFGAAAIRYVQNHALAEAEHPDGANPKYYDVIDEIDLRDPALLAALSHDRTLQAAVRNIEADLLETERTRALVTETVVSIS